jgi:PAS domain S-box-containing protein
VKPDRGKIAGIGRRGRRPEAQAGQQRSRFDQLFEYIPLPAYNVSLDGSILDLNRAALDLLKIENKRDVIAKPVVRTIYAPACRAKAGKLLAKWKRTGNLQNEELQVLTGEGEIRDVLLNVETILDENGIPQSSISVHLDITERKCTERALRRAEEQSRMYLDMAGVILMALDREGRIVLANPKACSVLEGEEADIVGRDWFSNFVPQHTRREVKRVFRQLMSGSLEPAEHFENQVVSLEGNPRWIAWHNTVMKSRDGDILGTFSSGEDITERRQTKRALRESEERFRELTDTLPQVVFEVDLRGTITYANQRAFELFGYVGEDLKKGLQTLEMIASQDHDRARENIQMILSGEKPKSTEYSARRKDGSTFPIMIHSTRIVRNGEVVGLRGIICDLSEHKAAEKALRESEEILRQSQKMEAMGRLAGGVAHDFNNLLTTILGYSEMLLSDAALSEEVLSSIREVSRSARRAGSLTQQLLAYSRKQVLRPEELNVNELVENLSNMLRRLIHENIQLSTLLEPDLGWIKADPAQLEQVIINLAINARDAMPDGGNLTIETRELTLDKGFSRRHPEAVPGKYVMLAVTDTGHGIDAESQKMIFEPFFTTKAPGKGTGLGLATVFGTVQQSNGLINVYSEPGVGSTFKIYLPVVERRTSAEEQRPEVGADVRTDRTILLVEDDEALRKLVDQVLKETGYTVFSAGNGEDALDLLEQPDQVEVDLLISDVIMPGIGGKELSERLRALRPDLKVLFMSGYPDETVVHHGVLDEDVAYLQKPFSPNTIIQKVQEILTEV